jgi:hypothetical protein
MSSLVGALLLARGMDDQTQSQRILHSMRRMLRREFAGSGESKFSPQENRSAPGLDFPSHDLRGSL